MSRAALLAVLAVAGCTGAETKHMRPAFSADASHSPDCGEGHIVFVKHGAVHRMRADGTDEQQLTDGDGDSSPRWSPDGSRIAFLRHGNLWIMDADGENPHTALEDSLVAGTASRLAWSPDGGRIAIGVTGSSWPVTVYDVSFDTVQTAGYISTDRPSELYVAWTPDGSILYAYGRRVTKGNVLIEVEGSITGIACSPDGRYIAVARHLPNANPGLRGEDWTEIFDLQGTSLGTVFESREASDPFWSPDSGCLGVTYSGHLRVGDLLLGSTRAFEGEMGDWIRSTPEDDAPPVAAFTAVPGPGTAVTFDATASSDDFGIAEYSWDFDGDGLFESSGTDATVAYEYPASGSYDVMLRVRDTAGQWGTATRTVTISPEKVTLTIAFPPGDMGSVTVNVDGLEVSVCTATCTVETLPGATVTLTAGLSYGWDGCDAALGNVGTLTMNSDRTVTLLPPS